jgi:hypothetical protein
VDLLLGGWAAKHLATLPADQLAVYDGILQLETVTLYNVLTHRSPIPAAADTPLLRAIVEYTKGSPLGHASPEVGGDGARCNRMCVQAATSVPHHRLPLCRATWRPKSP